MPPAQAPSRRGQATGQPAQRRTVVIRGQVAPPRAGRAASGRAIGSTARRRPPRRAHERLAAVSPDRAALYAVLMGVVLILMAILTAHGA